MKDFDIDEFIEVFKKAEIRINEKRKKDEEELYASLDKFRKTVTERVVDYIENNRAECMKHGIKIMSHPDLLLGYTYLILADIVDQIKKGYDIEVEIVCSPMLPNTAKIHVMSMKPFCYVGDLFVAKAEFESKKFDDLDKKFSGMYHTREKKEFKGAIIGNPNEL